MKDNTEYYMHIYNSTILSLDEWIEDKETMDFYAAGSAAKMEKLEAEAEFLPFVPAKPLTKPEDIIDYYIRRKVLVRVYPDDFGGWTETKSENYAIYTHYDTKHTLEPYEYGYRLLQDKISYLINANQQIIDALYAAPEDKLIETVLDIVTIKIVQLPEPIDGLTEWRDGNRYWTDFLANCEDVTEPYCFHDPIA